MTREIKFRMWDGKAMMKVHADSKTTDEFKIIDWDLIFNKQRGVEVMQFIGLKDVYSRDIYEGDILKWFSGIGDVYFEDARFNVRGFYVPSQDEPSDAFGEDCELEIIGNIYENPELIADLKQ